MKQRKVNKGNSRVKFNFDCLWSLKFFFFSRFILQFVGQGGNNSDHCVHVLNIVETNPFKHLIHLSLKFIPGQDSDIKKYLADCLKQLKETNELLHQRLEHTNEDLTQRLQQTQEVC